MFFLYWDYFGFYMLGHGILILIFNPPQLWDVIFLRNYVGCISCLIETFLFDVFLETKTPHSQLLPSHATVNTTSP